MRLFGSLSVPPSKPRAHPTRPALTLSHRKRKQSQRLGASRPADRMERSIEGRTRCADGGAQYRRQADPPPAFPPPPSLSPADSFSLDLQSDHSLIRRRRWIAAELERIGLRACRLRRFDAPKPLEGVAGCARMAAIPGECHSDPQAFRETQIPAAVRTCY